MKSYEKKDKALDKKQHIKEGSKKDQMMDKMAMKGKKPMVVIKIFGKKKKK